MELARSFYCAAAFAFALSLVSGCGQPDSLHGAPSASILNGASKDAAAPKEIVYVSDSQKGAAHAYNYETGARDGDLRHFRDPEGQCVDAKGDVFIADFGETTVTEFRHGATRPIKTFEAHGSPIGCSVAPNGDLAIANDHTPSGDGDVLIFKRGGGKPKTYSNSACSRIIAAGYDGSGNLYVEPSDYQVSVLCELRQGGSSLKVVRSIELNRPGSVMWDGKHITLTDSAYNNYSETAIYQMHEDRSGNLNKLGQTVLTADACGGRPQVIFPFIVGAANTPENKQLANAVVGQSYAYDCGKLSVWKYPDGGNPVRTIKVPVRTYTQGQSVSIGE